MLLVAFLFFLISSISKAQNWRPTILNDRGDTIAYTFPPPDTSYKPNEIIVKFRPADGIIHSQSLDVSVKTYQYDLYDNNVNYIGHVPPDNKLGLNISAFGLEKPLSVEFGIIPNSSLDSYIYPNTSSANISLVFSLVKESEVNIQFMDLLGNTCFTLNEHICPAGVNKKDIDISKLANGIYYCRIYSEYSSQAIKFTVLK